MLENKRNTPTKIQKSYESNEMLRYHVVTKWNGSESVNPFNENSRSKNQRTERKTAIYSSK